MLIDYIKNQIKKYFEFCPAFLPPGKIFSIARVSADLPASVVAEFLKVSRSYLVQIETGTRPLPQNWNSVVLSLLRLYRHNPDVQKFLDYVFMLLPEDKSPMHLINDPSYLFMRRSSLLKKISVSIATLEDFCSSSGLNVINHIENICYIYLSSVLPEKTDNVEVTYEETPAFRDKIKAALFDSVASYYYPPREIPTRVLTNSHFLAWLTGVITTETLLKSYEKKGIYLIADRETGLARKDPAVLAGLLMFFFKDVICRIAAYSDYPVEIFVPDAAGKKILPVPFIGTKLNELDVTLLEHIAGILYPRLSETTK